MRFFADHHISPPITRALNELSTRQSVVVTPLRDRFPTDVKDEEWLRVLGEERDWVILSGDYAITKKPHERKAWLESGLTIFFLQRGWTNIDFWTQAWKLVKWWPTIIETAQSIETGQAWGVPVSGAKLKVIPR